MVAEEKDSARPPYKAMLAGGAAALLVWVAWGVLAASVEGQCVGSGTFGDAFGPITGFATALALGAAIWSTIMQRAELQATLVEMHKQANAQKDLADKQERANELAEMSIQTARVASEIEIANLWRATFGEAWVEARVITMRLCVHHKHFNRHVLSQQLAGLMAPYDDVQGSAILGHRSRTAIRLFFTEQKVLSAAGMKVDIDEDS